MRVENFRLSAICRTSKSKCSVVEGATSIAIQTAAIAGIPDDVSIDRYKLLESRIAHQKLAPHQMGCGFPYPLIFPACAE